jgi:ribosomal protein L37AE/L43A
MKMMHTQKLRQTLKCNLCGGIIPDHAAKCPRLLMERIKDIMMLSTYQCPACIGGYTLVNRDDFIECRKCHTVFTTGPAHPETARTTILGGRLAKELPEKGRGDFPLLERLMQLREVDQELLDLDKKNKGEVEK